MKEWHCVIFGQPYGPFGEEQLKEMIGRGEIAADTLVWSGSTQENAARGWVAASDTELAALFAPPPEAPQEPEPPAAFAHLTLAAEEPAQPAEQELPAAFARLSIAAEELARPIELKPIPEPSAAFAPLTVPAAEPIQPSAPEPAPAFAPQTTAAAEPAREDPAALREPVPAPIAPPREFAAPTAPILQAPLADRQGTPFGVPLAGASAPNAPQTSLTAAPQYRFAAFMINLVILLAFVLIFVALSIFLTRGPGIAGLVAGIAAVLLALGVTGLNLHLLNRDGQSIGKKAMRVRIADRDGNPVPLWRIVVLRWSLFYVMLIVALAAMYVTPYIGALGNAVFLLDSCFILRKDRRALHDLIAGTTVVKA